MGYDRDRLHTALAAALDPFIPSTTLAVGRTAVIDSVTEVALDTLTFICGDPDTPTPRGLLGHPIVEHPRCADPDCPLCRRGHALVLGRLL
jgi:hypothetical protein